MSNPYESPVYLCRNVTTTGVQPAVLDIGSFSEPGYPPVVQLVISAATVKIEGSQDAVNFVDFSGGGFTVSDCYDLVPGVRFWRINITANAGSVTVMCGAGPTGNGKVGLPNLLIVTNTNASL